MSVGQALSPANRAQRGNLGCGSAAGWGWLVLLADWKSAKTSIEMLMKVFVIFVLLLLPNRGRFLMRRAEIRLPAGFRAYSTTG
jgi:hypothetical protein